MIVASRVEEGNPCDKTLAVPMVKKSIEVLNKAPEEVAADRGFNSSENGNGDTGPQCRTCSYTQAEQEEQEEQEEIKARTSALV